MWEGMVEVFTATDFWGIVIKVLVTAVLTGLVGLCATLIGKLIAKCKNSKIYKYAKTCVEAAEQKFPNEGTKMGPEKMQYVMDQLAIAFPKIKDNRFLMPWRWMSLFVVAALRAGLSPRRWPESARGGVASSMPCV